MSKFKQIIGILIVIFVLAPLAADGAPIAGTVPLSNTLIQASTPSELVHFMKKYFNFVYDEDLFGQLDHWQSPTEFWNRKAGDCEDYALFSQYALKSLGYEALVVSFYDAEGNGHTVTMFKENGKFNVINEDRLYNYQSATIQEALTRINPVWVWGGIAEKRGTRGWLRREIRNPAFNK